MTSSREGPESASIFRAEALRAKGEPPPPVALAARWPAAAGGAVALCAALLVAVPALCWVHYAPEQTSSGRWSRSDAGAALAQFQVPRHPRGAIRVGDPVDIVPCHDGDAPTRGRVVATRDLDTVAPGPGRILVEVGLPHPADGHATARTCVLTARFRPARTPWRDLVVLARARAGVGIDHGRGGD